MISPICIRYSAHKATPAASQVAVGVCLQKTGDERTHDCQWGFNAIAACSFVSALGLMRSQIGLRSELLRGKQIVHPSAASAEYPK